MNSLHLLLLVVAILAVSAFDKNSVRKGKRDPSEKHPISRRVLRFERQIDSGEFPEPEELPYPIPMMDFAKVLPDLPIKYKPNDVFPGQLASEMDF